jgi:hypothetical protein
VETERYSNVALDNDVRPSELSEIITHLAFYSGWLNALSAVAIVKDIFGQRGIGTDQLPPASPELLPLTEAAESERASRVQQDFGHVSPVSCISRPTCSFVSCGFVPPSRPGTGALSWSARSSPRDKPADYVSPQSHDGQRPDQGAGVRGADASRLLCRQAECIFGITCR